MVFYNKDRNNQSQNLQQSVPNRRSLKINLNQGISARIDSYRENQEIQKRRNYNGFKLNSNWRNIIVNKMNQEDIKAFYFSAKRNANEKNSIILCGELQNLISKIGLLVDLALDYPKLNSSDHNFITILKYLCFDVLNDKPLYHKIMAQDINKKANENKHSLSYNESNVEELISAYNSLVFTLIERLDIKQFKHLIIELEEPNINESCVEEDNVSEDVLDNHLEENNNVKEFDEQLDKLEDKIEENKFSLKAQFIEKSGVITKGIFKKENEYEFGIKTTCSPESSLKSVKAVICKKDGTTKEFHLVNGRSSDIDNTIRIKVSEFDVSPLFIKVYANFAVTMFRTKTICCTLQKTLNI